MTYNRSQIHPYLRATETNYQLFPLNRWNKYLDGKPRGKTPVHKQWRHRTYTKGEIKHNVKKGYNLGVNLTPSQIIVDLDPRNYPDGVDIEQKVAEYFDFFDFDELLESLPVVKTSGGGYHIYCLLPNDDIYQRLQTSVDSLSGVDFKKHGGYVVAAGSRHPNGRYYEWVNDDIGAAPILNDDQLRVLIKPVKVNDNKNRGSLTNEQLEALILDKLDVTDYGDNDSWFPIMCACHYVTSGQGIDEFVNWSLGDPDYQEDEDKIVGRWESLDDDNDVVNTAGTLIHELERVGEDTQDLRAILNFAEMVELESSVYEDESEEKEILTKSKKIAGEISIEEFYKDSDVHYGEEGAALGTIKNLPDNPNGEQVNKCLRLINNADTFEASKATDLLVKRTGLSKAVINKMLKETEAKIIDDLALIISRKTLEVSFNKGKHLSCTPSGLMYAYKKTHWVRLSDEFLSKIIQSTLHTLKEKIEIKSQELSLINQSVKLSRIQVATLTDRMHSTELPIPVVNCKNYEIWINRDGTHEARHHDYKSYQLNCLNVMYSPEAECPLFMSTLEGIFERFPDGEDIIRHLAEVMGYMIQPYKNIASWWLFRGPGGDGKSTLLKILNAVLGEAMLMTSTKIFKVDDGTGDNHGSMSLVGTLAIVIEELPIGYLLKDAALKGLSENTKKEANPKGKDAFKFMYGGSLIMCSNGFPATKDLSHGMIRRANVIPFNRQFDQDGTEDLDRATKIINDKNEMSGVLNFMLEGLFRLRSRGKFKVPDSCQEAKNEWLEESNNIIRFVKETIDRDKPKSIICDFNILYELHYQAWCQNNDIDDKLRKRKLQFKRDLNNLGIVVKPGGGNVLKAYGGKLKKNLEQNEFGDW